MIERPHSDLIVFKVKCFVSEEEILNKLTSLGFSPLWSEWGGGGASQNFF